MERTKNQEPNPEEKTFILWAGYTIQQQRYEAMVKELEVVKDLLNAGRPYGAKFRMQELEYMMSVTRETYAELDRLKDGQ